MKFSLINKTLTVLLVVFSFGFVIPEQREIPVENASPKDWNSESFWYYPWGKSRTHKGIDIFAKEGTPVKASTGGFILYNGKISMGGNVVFMLGPKWRFHYYAHLKDSMARRYGFVDAGQQIGWVGMTGNAAGKSPHLHYSIKSMYPQIWKYNAKHRQAWNRLFFVNPDEYLRL